MAIDMTNLTVGSVTDAMIEAFRAELIKDAHACDTDAPYLCLRALRPARGRSQEAARAKARARVVAAMMTWIESGRDGAAAISLALHGPGDRAPRTED